MKLRRIARIVTRLSGAILLFQVRAPGQGSSGSIRGIVYDQDFDAPLAAAKVSTVELGKEVVTTDQGTFALVEVPPGKYTLVVAKDGYVRQVKPDVVVTAGQLTEVSVWLAGDFTDMAEFVVQDLMPSGTGTEAALLNLRFESPSLMDSISADLMSRAGASDAAGALRLVAGASVQNGKSAVIRGLPDRYVSSQMNGVRLPSADEDKRAVELDQFPAAVIESIQVSKTFTPDQQGDASGGAVNVRLKGIPDEPFFIKVRAQATHNTQVTGRSSFLSYEGGGVHFLGKGGGDRGQQTDNVGENFTGAVGVQRVPAPVDFKWAGSAGGKHEFGNGTKIGGFASFFYEHDSAHDGHGIDDSYWVTSPGSKMTPKTAQGTPQENDFKTALFDVVRSSESVQWGGLATVGIESERHALTLAYLYTRTAEDAVSLAEDTRGKAHFYPGHDPDDPDTPGHGEELGGAPYLRLETLEYTERTTETLQLNGRHELPVDRFGMFSRPALDWTVALSSADLTQPDKRQFGSLWQPGRQVGTITIPPTHYPFKPSANFTLGNLQRIWKEIGEDSEQYAANLKLPFEPSSETKGYLKIGVFADRVERRFNQDTFSNFNDNKSFAGEFGNHWSRSFPFEDHAITESKYDVDYRGRQKIAAWYTMLDVPLSRSLSVIGGVRFESTDLSITNEAEELATWFPKGSLTQTRLNPGDADVDFGQHDALPSIGVVFTPVAEVTVRASYNQTVARQTFKELTPILQQEFLGGPIFIGNPELKMSALENYDLRVDYTPYEGGLFSASWFRKDIKGAIEYVQRITSSFDFTTAANYPRGRLSGFEFEARQGLGTLWSGLDGLGLGANATLIDSQVTLPDDEAAGFEVPGIDAPMRTRDMTNAPEHLYNAYVTYELPATGSQLAFFYTIQGDTLIAGAGQSAGNLIPNVYATAYDTLNFTLSQALGQYTKLEFRAKNLTDARIETVYRSPYIGDDVRKTSHTTGVEYSLGIGGEIRF